MSDQPKTSVRHFTIPADFVVLAASDEEAEAQVQRLVYELIADGKVVGAWVGKDVSGRSDL